MAQPAALLHLSAPAAHLTHTHGPATVCLARSSSLPAAKSMHCNNQSNKTFNGFSGCPLLPLLLLQIDILRSVGLRQDEICNMASISVVLLGLNPDTRIKPVIEYLRDRGVPSEQRSVQRALLRPPALCPAAACGPAHHIALMSVPHLTATAMMAMPCISWQ